MARKKQHGNPLLAALIVVVVIIAMLLAYVAPPLLLLAWLFTEARLRSSSVKALKSSGLVTSREASALQELEQVSDEAARVVSQLREEGEAAGLYYRADNLFDARNQLGRELNREIERAQRQRLSADEQRDGIHQQIADRAGLLVSSYAQRAAARGAVLVWGASYLLLMVVKPDWGSFGQSAAASGVACAAAAIIAPARSSLIRGKLAIL